MIDTNELTGTIQIDASVLQEWANSTDGLLTRNEVRWVLAELDRLRADNERFSLLLQDYRDVGQQYREVAKERIAELEARIAELEGENAAKESDLIKWRMGDYGYSERR